MKTSEFKLAKRTLTMAAALVLLGGVGAALPKAGHCDDSTYNMAPPISTDQDQSNDDTADTPSTVFNWQEVPANQPVPITRAVFDQGGYQLFDNVGETIVVKFKNDNLYVMKFAVSQNGTMYFVNSGTSPILYVPEDGYLENATVDGAKWYPFTPDFQPSTPVFLGIAPSWSDYVDVGWYPDMCCYGGYWCGTTVGFFEPSFGLVISFGDQRFDGWDGYIGYCDSYPPPFEIGIYHEDRYRFASRSYWGGRSFHGGDRGGYSGRPFPGGRSIGGSPGFSTQGRAFRGGTNPGEDRSFYRTGVGVNGGSHSDYGGGFRGGSSGGNHSDFSGGFRGGSPGGFNGGARSDSGGGFHGGGPGGFGGGGGFHGGAPGGSNGGGDFRGGSGAIGGGGFQGGGGGGRHR